MNRALPPGQWVQGPNGQPVFMPFPVPGARVPIAVRPPLGGGQMQSRRIDPEDVAPRVPGPPAAVPVREVERPLSGQYPSNIGNQILIDAPVPNYDANGVAEVTAEVLHTDANGCSQGESLILTLGLDVVANDVREAVFVIPQVRARVKFGNGSVSRTALLDWMNGTQVAFGSKQLYVEAVYRLVTSPTSPETLAAPPKFQVQAMTSYGTLNQNSHGARLTEILSFTTGPQFVRVPDFATAFTVVPFDSGAWTAELVSWGTGASVDYAGGGGAIDGTTYNVENANPIYNGARWLRVDSESNFSGAVIFDLAF